MKTISSKKLTQVARTVKHTFDTYRVGVVDGVEDNVGRDYDRTKPR